MQPGSHEMAGVTSPAEDASSDPSPPAQDTGQLMPLDPRARTLWWVTGAGVVVPIGIVAGLVDLFAPLPLRRGLLTGAVLLVGGLLAAIVPVLRYRRWRYALRPADLWIRHGVLWVTVSVIPFSRLQFVDTRQGPLDRLFGLSQLVVHTAALGTSGRLPGLDATEAERLRERLAEVEPDDDASV
ncbi:MAG: PH domain-containing protein [Egibacteraceae bacterium]